MKIIQTHQSLREWISSKKCCADQIALVPTMGNLHSGHLELVNKARQIADQVIVSIFVNPTQFGPDEDFEAYPKTLKDDQAKLEATGCDVLFAPAVEEMYPDGTISHTVLAVPALDQVLCGRSRPGHFDGVCQVVARLFNQIQPDIVVFGEKDRQQLIIIQAMVRDLAFPVKIVSVPTVRDEDGLALSSRNQYLTHSERQLAPMLYQKMLSAIKEVHSGRTDWAQIELDLTQRYQGLGFKVDYVQILDVVNLQHPKPDSNSPMAMFVAVFLGKARLIDNALV